MYCGLANCFWLRRRGRRGLHLCHRKRGHRRRGPRGRSSSWGIGRGGRGRYRCCNLIFTPGSIRGYLCSCLSLGLHLCYRVFLYPRRLGFSRPRGCGTCWFSGGWKRGSRATGVGAGGCRLGSQPLFFSARQLCAQAGVEGQAGGRRGAASWTAAVGAASS